MDVAALIVAIVALLFAVSAAGFGVYIQFQTYKATTDHLRGVEGSVSGLQDRHAGSDRRAEGHDTYLGARAATAVQPHAGRFRHEAGAAAEVAEKTGESADRLQQISEEMDALKEELRQAASADEVQHKLDELASRVEAVSVSTARAASLAELAAEAGPSVRTRLRGRSDAEISFFPARVGIGEGVKIHAVADDAKEFVCIVRSPYDEGGVVNDPCPDPQRRQGRGHVCLPWINLQGASTDHPGFYSVQVTVRTSLRLPCPRLAAPLRSGSDGPGIRAG